MILRVSFNTNHSIVYDFCSVSPVVLSMVTAGYQGLKSCIPVFVQPCHSVLSLPSIIYPMCIIYPSISHQDIEIKKSQFWIFVSSVENPFHGGQSHCEDNFLIIVNRSQQQRKVFLVCYSGGNRQKHMQAQMMQVEQSEVIFLEISFHPSFMEDSNVFVIVIFICQNKSPWILVYFVGLSRTHQVGSVKVMKSII